jgi:hypothetical protein
MEQVMCEGDRFDKLIRRAFQTCDELAFKVLRNLSQQENIGVKRRFGPYIEQMVMLLKVSVQGMRSKMDGTAEILFCAQTLNHFCQSRYQVSKLLYLVLTDLRKLHIFL